MPCNCCQMTDNTFGEGDARSGLRQYQRRGPTGQTRELLKAVRTRDLRGATLLDIGGGIGAIHHELLENGVTRATHVDASSAYLHAAEGEAARRGHAGRVQFIQADFTDVASNLPPADIVTLDRVVCCYPDFRSLLTAAASRSQQILALTYPRETWYVRLVISVMDGFRRCAVILFASLFTRSRKWMLCSPVPGCAASASSASSSGKSLSTYAEL